MNKIQQIQITLTKEISHKILFDNSKISCYCAEAQPGNSISVP